jgi:hypothetical protein
MPFDWRDVDIQEAQEEKREVAQLSVMPDDSEESIFSLLFTDAEETTAQ